MEQSIGAQGYGLGENSFIQVRCSHRGPENSVSENGLNQNIRESQGVRVQTAELQSQFRLQKPAEKGATELGIRGAVLRNVFQP
jgi:hypothetical protein